jgi:hypothetical protein
MHSWIPLYSPSSFLLFSADTIRRKWTNPSLLLREPIWLRSLMVQLFGAFCFI